MNFFLMGSVAGIGIICSLAGWGWLFLRVLRIRLSTLFGFNAAVGMALSTTLGGILNWFGVISPGLVRAYLVAGLLIFAFAGIRHIRSARDGIVSAWASFKPRRLLAFGAFVLVLVSVSKYATAVSPGWFNPQDDYHGYFVFPVKMIQTGHLGSDPFSERRIVTSLGGKAFLDTFPLSFTGNVSNLDLIDEGVAFLILLLLLYEIMARKGIPALWAMMLLLAASMFEAPTSNITAVYCGVVLLVLLFDLLDRTVFQPETNQIVLVAIVLGSLTSLKTTFAPMAGVFFLCYFGLQFWHLPGKVKTLARAGLCAALSLILLLPWMLDSYLSSGTFIYPVFGKGYHGSRYGTYLLPTANMGIHNILAFLNGLANTLGAILAIQAGLILGAFLRTRRDRLVDLVIVVNLLIDVVVIALGTGGVQMYRYSFAILFATALFLVIDELAAFAGSPGVDVTLGTTESFAAILLLGMLLGTAWHGFMTGQRDSRIAELKFAISGQSIDSLGEVSDYRNMQLAIPPGQKVLVRLDKNFLLDFRRNPIYVDDLPGGASLPPGIPSFHGPEALAEYLVNHGIRYLAYSYGDEATFSREVFGGRLQENVNVWLRRGAQIAFDFQDNAVLLGQTRKRLFDNGKMFILDLETRVPSNSTNVARGRQGSDSAGVDEAPSASVNTRERTANLRLSTGLDRKR
jgi:hypothetical protein